MKQLMIVLLSALGLILNLKQESIAQVTPCPACPLDNNCQWAYPGDPSAYDESWPYFAGDPSTYERTLASSISYQGTTCFFRVVFKMRDCYCPDLRHELFLEKIYFENPACESIPKSEIISKAIQQLLYESQVIFKLTNLPFSITIKTPKCWRLDDANNQLITCNSECCSTKYWLSIQSSTVTVYDKEKEIIQPDNCPMVGTQTCEDICDANDIPLGDIFTDQMEGCPDDPCSDIEWDDKPTYKSTIPAFYHAKQVLLPSPGFGCHPKVNYETKRCPDGHIEVRITKIIDISDLCPQYNIPEGLIMPAIRKILKFLTLDYYPLTSATKVTVRIYDCWELITPYRLIPCNYSSCCYQDYWIDYYYVDDPDEVKVDYGLIVDQDQFKQFVPNQDCINDCKAICYSNVFRYAGDDLLLTKIATGEGKLTEPGNSGLKTSKTFIRPVPADNKLEIIYESDYKGNVTLKITDILGNAILTKTEEKKGTTMTFDIDISNYETGDYFYKIISDTRDDNRGKFIIVK